MHSTTAWAYLWSYCSTSMSTMKAVVFDFAESRGGRHADAFLGRLARHAGMR
jgi:transposase